MGRKRYTLNKRGKVKFKLKGLSKLLKKKVTVRFLEPHWQNPDILVPVEEYDGPREFEPIIIKAKKNKASFKAAVLDGRYCVELTVATGFEGDVTYAAQLAYKGKKK